MSELDRPHRWRSFADQPAQRFESDSISPEHFRRGRSLHAQKAEQEMSGVNLFVLEHLRFLSPESQGSLRIVTQREVDRKTNLRAPRKRLFKLPPDGFHRQQT